MNFNHDTGAIDTILTIDPTATPPLGGTAGVLTIVGTGGLQLPVGTTAQAPANSQGLLRYNSDTARIEFNNGSTWSSSSGSVTSVAISGSTGLSVSGSPITSSGTITLTLGTELQGLSGLASNGILARTAAGTYAARTIAGTASNIVVTNGDGVAGAPTINLATVTDSGTGTFKKITTDTFGRVTGTTNVVAADITALVDASYVNVSGDSMTSGANLTFSGGGTVTGLPTTPVGSTDAASKAYVDSLAQGLDPKGSVRAATTAAGTLASSFANGQVIDGVTLATGNRILIKNQAAPAENGIYTVNASGAPTRAVDMDVWTEVPGAFLFVEEGTTLADTGWVCTSNQGGTINTTAITFTQFGGAGTYTAGTGLTLTGTQFSLTSPVAVANGGTGLTTTPTNGQIDIGNGSGFTRTTLTQGTGVTVTNGAGSITIANAGVTSIVAGTGISVSGATGAVTVNNTGVTSVAVSGSTGLSVSGSPITTTGTITLTLGTELQGLSGLATNGMIARTAAGTYAARTITGTANQITVTNGDGVAGAPTIAIASNVILPGTGSMTVPSGTTAQQPAVGAGQLRYDTSTNQLMWSTGSTWNAIGTGSGTVTSVAVSGGTTGLTTSGGPITNSGTITLAGTLVTANGGTGLSSIGTANQILGVNTGATGLEYKTVTAGTGISVTPAAGSLTIANTGVTSVALSLGGGVFTISGSPVTTTGTLTGTLASQTANTVFAAPNGSSGAPTFRTLAMADLPIKLYAENSSSPTAPSATGTNAEAFGSGAVASLYGMKAFANGNFATAGDAQKGLYILRNITTNNTATELFLDGATATQRIVIPNNSVVTFHIKVAGRRTDATGGGAGYTISGVIRKDTTAGSTTMIGAASVATLGETNTAWGVAASADTTNGSLRITVTGEAAKTIRWVAVVETAEVTN